MLMTPGTILKLASIGLTAGFCNAWVGVSSSFVVGPTLMAMGIYPLVAGSIAMYVSMVNNTSSSITMFMFQRVNLAYAFAVCLFMGVATLPGTVLARKLIQWTGKRSVTVLLMLIIMGIALVLNPILSVISLPQMKADGLDIMEWGSYC